MDFCISGFGASICLRASEFIEKKLLHEIFEKVI